MSPCSLRYPSPTTLSAQFDNQGDGGDYGDWQSRPRPDGVTPQVQDAFATPGARPVLTIDSPEVRALDVIGYDLSPQGAVPEPSTGLGGVIGVLVALGYAWRRGVARLRVEHPGGVNWLFGDGSVRSVKSSISGVTWRSLGSVQAGEVIGSDAY